jgi:short-subunit dehydrogenase
LTQFVEEACMTTPSSPGSGAARPGAALITGASAGFGAAYARAFAARGHDLVLVARRVERLEALAAELSPQVGVTVLPCDLTAPDAARSLVAELDARGLDVEVLVNNAGAGTYGPFAGEDLDRVTREITLNVTAVTQLTLLLWPRLLASGRGVLVDVTSTAGYQPLPYIAVYAATKAYARALTQALWFEARGTGTTVLAVAPGPTRTEFFDAAGSDGFAVGQILTVDQVVRATMRALDRRRPPLEVVVGWRNALSARLPRLLPQRAVVSTVGRMTAPRPGTAVSGAAVDGAAVEGTAVSTTSPPAPAEAGDAS